MKRFVLAATLIVAPILAGAAVREGAPTAPLEAPFAGGVEWRAALGPVDPLPLARDSSKLDGLTVHEWGTFTSVAGPDGTAIDWLPAGGPTDLPCFVTVSGAGPKGLPDREKGERASRAKIRMETPVIYFYSPRQEFLNVRVAFPQGLMTEWYPPATIGPGNQWEARKAFPNVTSIIEWNNVVVTPGAPENFPIEPAPSHYYAARATDAAPVQVKNVTEKFLFYRGIASFDPPISVKATTDGKFSIANLEADTIPAVIVFENRHGKLGYRVHRNLSGPVKLDRPELTANLKSLQRDLEEILQQQGMYALEARAMVDTWKDTWFEQGARVFYIVPTAKVDELLPLQVTPKPVSVARAFVGRMEVITPASEQDVRLAVQTNDRVMLETYGRFLEPIVEHFLAGNLSAEERYRELNLRKSIRDSYVAQVTACSKGHSW